MLELPIHGATRFVLVRPHYPENVGAAARAIKTMGFRRLALVRPGRLAVPEHEMAHKMAVKAWDVLQAAGRFATLGEALADVDLVLGTTSRRGVSHVLDARQAAALALDCAATGGQVALVFGNEKTGLSSDELELTGRSVRIPMAADQPSINLAQAAQLVAYEFFVGALARREQERASTLPSERTQGPGHDRRDSPPEPR
jgi:tRNA (cytidine32/uridine32-2'-O)-methyltransferase